MFARTTVFADPFGAFLRGANDAADREQKRLNNESARALQDAQTTGVNQGNDVFRATGLDAALLGNTGIRLDNAGKAIDLQTLGETNQANLDATRTSTSATLEITRGNRINNNQNAEFGALDRLLAQGNARADTLATLEGTRGAGLRNDVFKATGLGTSLANLESIMAGTNATDASTVRQGQINERGAAALPGLIAVDAQTSFADAITQRTRTLKGQAGLPFVAQTARNRSFVDANASAVEAQDIGLQKLRQEALFRAASTENTGFFSFLRSKDSAANIALEGATVRFDRLATLVSGGLITREDAIAAARDPKRFDDTIRRFSAFLGGN